MATWGLKMLDAALKRNAISSSISTSAVTSTSGTTVTVNCRLDVNPEDPFDVECNVSTTQKEQMEIAEDGANSAIDEFGMISDECDDDADYVPNSASEDSDDSNGSESIIYPCGPMLSPAVMPVITSSVGSSTQNEHFAMDVDTTPDTTCPIGTRSKKPKRNCKFCNEWQTHLKRHIIRTHKQEEEVIMALTLPLKEQSVAFATMRKEGIYKKNMELSRDRLPLIRERNQGTAMTVMCSGCRGFYEKRTIFKHKRSCHKCFSKDPCTVEMTRQSVNAESLDLPNDFVSNVLQHFRKDAAGDLCKKDLAILLLGKRLWAKSVKKERHVIMSEMRSFANLLVVFRKYVNNENAAGVDILHYTQFDALEKSIKEITEGNDKSKSGLKVRLGFILKRAAKVMRGYYIIRGESQKEEDLTKFLNALQLQWDFIFYTAQVECEARREGLRKPTAMPDNNDIKLLRSFIQHKMNLLLDNNYQIWDSSTFVQMRNLIVTRLTMFNARRSGEPVRLTLNEWRDANSNVWIDQDQVEQVDDPQEKALLNDMKLCYQAGKGSRKLVPVLIPKDSIRAIQRLCFEREACGIHSENIYLFPNTHNSLDHASGYHCLKAVVKDIPGLKSPHLLIADKFRHMVSTLFASLELPEEQRNIFVRHMGHSEAVNRNVYQCPMAVREVTRVGQFLSTIDTDTGLQCISQEVRNDIPPTEVAVTTQSEPEAMHTYTQQSVVETSNNVLSNRKQRKYTKWSEKDTKLVREHFNSYIVDTSNNGRLPSKEEVIKFIDDHDVLNGHDNKVELVRTKVFNEKKKFREGCCKNI